MSATTVPVPKLSWLFQLAAAGILGMTLPFKFSGAEESVQLFTDLGAEPYGRLGTGVLEAIAVILLVVLPLLGKRTAGLGGVLTMGLMGGAIFSHLTVLGISYQGDPTLFVLAVVALVCGGLTAYFHRHSLPIIGDRF